MSAQRWLLAALVVGLCAVVLRRVTLPARCEPPLANVLNGAVDDALAARVLDLAQRAVREKPEWVGERNFGVGSKGEGGHRVVHLKHAALAQPAFLQEIWLLSRRADAWGVTTSRRLPLRCMELIEYSSVENHSLGYHHDGDSFLTVSVLLSTPGVDFDGGRLELKRPRLKTARGTASCAESHTARARGVLAWRGWEWHRVAPVTRGVRRVLVIEWWAPAHAAEEGSTSFERGGDSLAGLREALSRDPSSLLLREGVDIYAKVQHNGASGA
eukprot:CAMPEP_0119377070 /NCGR_PEP_ID=MMETSP1334-20130426/42964_1 /TAXON_ID=127549 /ORGANISM="Calcidiscus leptoporus, Strain RCC1130" /LENGTH=270 /DNA_ID=CAMNT_0007395855 /DNA_START=241 /DNA_END=1053 /DNA_ORIENTATION=-